MAAHKFKVGQIVRYQPRRSVLGSGAREYKIVRQLPPENGQNQYRIKSTTETFERMAHEIELSRR